MCFATASKIPTLVNSAGTFIGGKLNFCCFAFTASRLALFTASGMQQKLSSICGVVALQHFSYSSKWWLVMWPRHVEFNPCRKHPLSVLFVCTPSSIAFSVFFLRFQVSNQPLFPPSDAYSLAKLAPLTIQHLNFPVFGFLNATSILSEKIVRRSCIKSFLTVTVLGAPSAWCQFRSFPSHGKIGESGKTLIT